MKRNHIILAVLSVLCAGVLVFSDRKADEQIVQAAPHASRQGGAAAARSASAAGVSIAALRSRAELIGTAGGATHELFGHLTMASPLPSAAPANAEMPPLPPLPPTPSMPFTYIGKQSAEGHWEVYLARGDDTLIVRDHAIIDGTYRVEAITPPTMKLVYLPLKLVQTMDIGSAD
jgi:hypothetical protein